MSAPIGHTLALCVAAKDHDGLRELLGRELDFRGMTPGRTWEAQDPEGVVAVFRTWFDDDDHIEAVDAVGTDRFADVERVGYRLRVRNQAGLHLVEQQAFLRAPDGRIGWLRIMCSGFRPIS